MPSLGLMAVANAHAGSIRSMSMSNQFVWKPWRPPPVSRASQESCFCLITSTSTNKKKKKKCLQRRVEMRIRPAGDRVVAATSYLLPLLNGLQYGRFLMANVPQLQFLLQPLLPVISLSRNVPLLTFAAFFGVYVGVVRNPRLSEFVRFNAMQALVVDVLLVLPNILQRILSPRSGFGVSVLVFGYNATFLALLGGFFYAFFCCILGRTPKIPFVADAATAQLG